MTGVGGPIERLDDPEVSHDARELYDVLERTAELEGQLAEQLERGRRATVELSAARRDLEVKEAYNLMLERIAGERAGHIETLQRQVAAAEAQLTKANERVQRQRRRLEKARRTKKRLRHRLDAVSQQWEAESSTSVHRCAAALHERLRRHRIVYALARPALRGIARKMGLLP